MRCYNQPHRFYCGVDLHARSLYIHVLDARGKTVLDRDLLHGRLVHHCETVSTRIVTSPKSAR